MRNRYDILPCGRAVIYLQGAGQEHAALIDAADLPQVASLNGTWYAQRRNWTIYAAITVREPGRGRYTIRLHRFLMDPPPDMEVDHINNDGLDNTRRNMRIVTPDANKANVRYGGGRDIGYRWYEAGCTEPDYSYIDYLV
ncbi:MAG TPA: hypothetical protein VN608_05605 [Clostridia bacterium]|nr:hypothetical protein [Clostridia bacterium]